MDKISVLVIAWQNQLIIVSFKTLCFIHSIRLSTLSSNTDIPMSDTNVLDAFCPLPLSTLQRAKPVALLTMCVLWNVRCSRYHQVLQTNHLRGTQSLDFSC